LAWSLISYMMFWDSIYYLSRFCNLYSRSGSLLLLPVFFSLFCIVWFLLIRCMSDKISVGTPCTSTQKGIRVSVCWRARVSLGPPDSRSHLMSEGPFCRIRKSHFNDNQQCTKKGGAFSFNRVMYWIGLLYAPHWITTTIRGLFHHFSFNINALLSIGFAISC
jgi:hypothetical protein